MLAKLTVTTLFALATARDLSFKTKNSNEMYVESTANNNTIGYSFSLYQNVLSVQINATLTGVKHALPNTFIVMPNLILEYNDMSPANSTQSIYGFLDKANDNKDWGNGLTATKHTSKATNSTNDAEVWEFAAKWTNPDGNRPEFQTYMYITSEDTEFDELKLTTNAISMRFSILNFPFSLENSTLALNQLILTEAGVNKNVDNQFNHDLNSYGAENLGALHINRTAFLDGDEGMTFLNVLDNSNNQIVAGNSTSLGIENFTVDNVLVSFSNSSGAQNVTFQQRLALDLSQLRTGMRAANAAANHGMSWWTSMLVLVSMLAVMLPIQPF